MSKLQDISPYELMAWMQAQRPFALLDVREEDERQHDHIGGEWIPMDEVLKRQQELPADKPLVVYSPQGCSKCHYHTTPAGKIRHAQPVQFIGRAYSHPSVGPAFVKNNPA
jgi:hypothetical protein